MIEWTGERFIPGVKGDIEVEHLHRYHAVAQLVRGLRVLDIACGEGYGSAILAHDAARVFGVDIDPRAVAHAQAKYAAEGISFAEGSCTGIPLANCSVDAIISFETLEHVSDHDATIREYRRVLAPGGWICISCPDKLEYSDLPRFRNPFHVRELYRAEFVDLLSRHFGRVALYGQRVVYGSLIGPIDRSSAALLGYRCDDRGATRGRGITRPVYFVGIASDGECPELPSGVFEPDVPPQVAELAALNERLARSNQERDQAAIEGGQVASRLAGQLEVAGATIAGLQAELAATVDGARLDAARRAAELEESAAVVVQLRGELETARRESLSHADSIRKLSERARQLDATILEIRSSRSWRLTAGPRWLATVAASARRRLAPRTHVVKLARYAYRALPLSPDSKRAAKETLFRLLPAIFSSTAAYQRWQAFGTERRALARMHHETGGPAAAAADAARAPACPPAGPGAALPDADGRWEWLDYFTLRKRILDFAAATRDEWRATPLTILDLDADAIDREIASIRFEASDDPLVTILVPAYNNLKYTVECLVAVARNAPKFGYEVILADDASTDASPDRLSRIPNLRIVRGDANLHFLENVNRALPAVRGRYLLLLNNDVQVRGDWLDVLVATAMREPLTGAVGPKFIYPSGHLQEAGCSFLPDCTSEMIGLNGNPEAAEFNRAREVDYCSGACLLVEAALFRDLGGFAREFAPAYCEDSDLCLRIRERGLKVLYEPSAVVIHHLSKTTGGGDPSAKNELIGRNLARFATKWQATIDRITDVRMVAFYLPQFHPVPENDQWWGKGFTEWRNVAKARPNFVGHYQPRMPADLGYYDLRVAEVMDQQAELARRYGVHGFCYYYYWFAGHRLLEMPLERMLDTGRPDLPYCLCWANENWTRRWDGQDREILIAQAHSEDDDVAVIKDLARHFKQAHYIRIDGRPLLLVYRISQFPDFASTARTWRAVCRELGIGEIYLALVESFDMVFAGLDPARFGCDAAVEFPPQGMAEASRPSGAILNPNFKGQAADYVALAARYCARRQPAYVRFRGIMPGWDNTARRQNDGFCFENATPGAFQAWAEHVIDETRRMQSGDRRIVFVNAWNEWAEGAYLEPDRRFGHAYLQALRNAQDTARLMRRDRYAIGT